MIRLPAALTLLASVSLAQPVERVIVIDGDTVRVIGTPSRGARWEGGRGEVIRLRDIDAPERGRGARCPVEARLAERAAAQLQELSRDGLILLRHGRDRYRRTLAEARTPDGRSVGAVMILLGPTRPYTGGPRAPWCGR